MLLFMLIIMFVLLFLGFPMFMTLGLPAVLVIEIYFPRLNPTVILQQMMDGISSFVLLAIPMYIFAADIMTRGYSATRLIDVVKAFVGHVYGGLAISLSGACTIFGAISGSTNATVAAIGKPLRGSLIDSGYPKDEVNALIVSAANLATLIPPSLGMIIYCVLTKVSVGELFIAGVVPGLSIFVMLAIYSYLRARKLDIPRTNRISWPERIKSVKKALLALGFPVIVIGGIYSGMFSPTEAAAVSVFYAAVCEVFIYHSVKMKDIYDIALSTGEITAALFILIAVGQAFSWFITYVRIPQQLTALVLGTDPSAVKILWTISIFFFISCMFVDVIVADLILVPIFYPIAIKAGVDPIHLGIIVTVQGAIGAITPPFGSNLFVACAAFKEGFWNMIKGLPPYLLIFVVYSILIIYFPEMTLVHRLFFFK